MEEQKELIDFGNYLLSDERKRSFQYTVSLQENAVPSYEVIGMVHDADLDNFKHRNGDKTT